MSSPLYVRNLDSKAHKKLDKIKKETGLAKWLIVENILCTTLGGKPSTKVDLSRWVKTK